jgi:hypothetical protein
MRGRVVQLLDLCQQMKVLVRRRRARRFPVQVGVAEEPQGMAEIMAVANEGLHPAVDLILVARKIAGDEIAVLEGVPPSRKEPKEERVGPEGMLLFQ